MIPFCPGCRKVPPVRIVDKGVCVSCLNRGHWVRLVVSEEDRQARIRLWTDFYNKHGYTPSEQAELLSRFDVPKNDREAKEYEPVD